MSRVDGEVKHLVFLPVRVTDCLNVPENVSQDAVYDTGVLVTLDPFDDLHGFIDGRRGRDLRQKHDLIESDAQCILDKGQSFGKLAVVESHQDPV
jgi:hypothetical protein